MAVVLIEGFDHLNTQALWATKGWLFSTLGAQPSNGNGVTQTTGRLANFAALVTSGHSGNGSGEQMRKVLPSTYSTLFAGAAFKFSDTSLDEYSFNLGAGGTLAVRLRVDTSGKIYVANSGGSTIASGTTALVSNTWYYIEMKAVIAGASGSITVNLNGVSEITVTTGNFGSSSLDSASFSVETPSGAAASQTLTVDDLYVVDSSGSSPRNTFLGDTRVETVFPSADGANTAWTTSSGSSHYSLVNENPPDGDSSYVQDSTPGDKDTYVMPALPTLVGTVFGVQVNLYARKDDANSRTIAPVVRQAGTDYAGTTSGGLSTSYLTLSQIYNQDPTGSDWTITSVNADEFGVKVVS